MSKESTSIHPSTVPLDILLDSESSQKIILQILKNDYETNRNIGDEESRRDIERVTKRRLELLNNIYTEEAHFPVTDDVYEDIQYVFTLLERQIHFHEKYKNLFDQCQTMLKDTKGDAYEFSQKCSKQDKQRIEDICKAKKNLQAFLQSIKVQILKEGGQRELISTLTLAESHDLIIQRMAKGA